MGKKNWTKAITYTLYFFVILNIFVCTERIVFDVFGQMWITMTINGLTGLASIVCFFGIYFQKKSAIIAYIVCCLLTLGVNLVIILIYNEVGLLKGTEKYLSLPLKGDSWWSNHGLFCYQVCPGSQDTNNNNNNRDNTDGSGGLSLIDGTLLLNDVASAMQEGGSGNNYIMQECFISYIIIESFHASLNMLLIIITILLALLMICNERRSPEEENFQYMGIGRYGGDAPNNNVTKRHKQQTFYKLSDSFNTLTTARSASNASSSSSM